VNLATGESHSVLDIIQETKEVSGKDIPFNIVDRRPGDPAELYAGTTLAFDQLDWKANHSGLKSLIETTWEVYK
jgi:UDP-glucose 4-epimerase